MNVPPSDRATNLRDAFRICKPFPLEGEKLEQYYVNLSAVRQTKAVEGVSQILDFQDRDESSAILFTGHRGCGKSTELKRIQNRWKNNYYVIYLETDLEIDIKDARYVDLYLLTIKQVEFELRREGLSFDRQLLSSFENWFKEVIEESEETVEKSVSLTGNLQIGTEVPFLAKLLAKLLAQVKGSDVKKKTIRQTLEQDISRLQSDINLLLRDGLEKLRQKIRDFRGFLIIFDNLDRVPPDVGDHLFFDYAAQLQELDCTVIYTVPISVLYSPKGLGTNFNNPNIVPMLNIYQFDRDAWDLAYDQTVLEAMARIIEQRVDVEAVFESRQHLLDMVKMSGGHVRQLMEIMQTACLTASTNHHTKIQAEDANYAIKQVQFYFERIIPNDHYEALANICLHKDVVRDETGQLLLYNTAALEYNGANRWNYINPVVKQINTFQKALEKATAAAPAPPTPPAP